VINKPETSPGVAQHRVASVSAGLGDRVTGRSGGFSDQNSPRDHIRRAIGNTESENTQERWRSCRNRRVLEHRLSPATGKHAGTAGASCSTKPSAIATSSPPIGAAPRKGPSAQARWADSNWRSLISPPPLQVSISSTLFALGRQLLRNRRHQPKRGIEPYRAAKVDFGPEEGLRDVHSGQHGVARNPGSRRRHARGQAARDGIAR
jgi:hypothetical protein